MINEFTAYELLGTYITAGTVSQRAETIATFALCGFANVGSVGIQGWVTRNVVKFTCL